MLKSMCKLGAVGLVAALIGCGAQNLSIKPQPPASTPEDSSAGSLPQEKTRHDAARGQLQPESFSTNCVALNAIRLGTGATFAAAKAAAIANAKSAILAQYKATFYNPALCPLGTAGISLSAVDPTVLGSSYAAGVWTVKVTVTASVCTVCN